MATVTRISIAPVKGLGLVHPDEVQLDTTGVLENRRFYIVDADGRRYGQIRNGRLVRVRPTYDAEAERLTLTFTDGTAADGSVELDDEITTQKPETGIPDFDTLRVLKDYRGLSTERELDFGVYGEVLEPGRIKVADAVEPVELSLLDATA